MEEIQRRIQIPFTFLPRGKVYYNVNTGKVDDYSRSRNERAFRTHANVAMGVTSRFTGKVGTDYIQFGDGRTPFFYSSLAARIATQYLVNLDLVPGTYYRAIGSVVYPSSASWRLAITQYQQKNILNRIGLLQDLSLNVYYPLRMFKLPVYTYMLLTAQRTAARVYFSQCSQISTRIHRTRLRLEYRSALSGSEFQDIRRNESVTATAIYMLPRNHLIPRFLHNTILTGEVSFRNGGSSLESARFGTFSVITDPNAYKPIDIPFYLTGIIDEKIVRQNGGRKNPVAGLRVHVRSVDGDYEQTLRTFADGSFYAMEIPRGTYEMTVDDTQLKFLESVPQPQMQRFTIRPKAEGDVVEGLNFALVEPGVIPETQEGAPLLAESNSPGEEAAVEPQGASGQAPGEISERNPRMLASEEPSQEMDGGAGNTVQPGIASAAPAADLPGPVQPDSLTNLAFQQSPPPETVATGPLESAPPAGTEITAAPDRPAIAEAAPPEADLPVAESTPEELKNLNFAAAKPLAEPASPDRGAPATPPIAAAGANQNIRSDAETPESLKSGASALGEDHPNLRPQTPPESTAPVPDEYASLDRPNAAVLDDFQRSPDGVPAG